MDHKYTLWNMPGGSWEGVPKDLKITDEVEQKIKDAMATPAPEEELRPYKTPINKDQIAKIIG